MSKQMVYVGTAGWSIPARYAEAVPPGGSHLQRYAAQLRAVEINSSFYRPHQRKTYMRWAASVPDHFRFAVKLPKTVTHERRLVGCEDLLDRFAEEASGLGSKLGVLLVQLPPSLQFDAEVAASFLTALETRLSAAVVCEPRHATWFTTEAEELLAARHVARVAADPAPVPGAGEPGGWRDFTYMRLHGAPKIYYSDYDEAALATITARLAAAKEPAWCILDNTAAFHALGNALAISRGLEALRSRQAGTPP